MKEKHDVDRRVLRTRQMLSDALFALIEERGYDAITVQDIAERANIGRATFYLHYHDKEELLSDSFKGLANNLIKSVVPDSTHSPTTYQTLSIHVFRHVAQHSNLYRALLGEAGPPMMVIRIRKYIAELIHKYTLTPLIAKTTSPVDPELLAIHAAGSLVALVTWWLEHDLSPSADEMGNLYWRLVSPGIDGILGEMPPVNSRLY